MAKKISERKSKLFWFKPSKNPSKSLTLTMQDVIENKSLGVETVLDLDLNVLAKIENIVENGNRARDLKRENLFRMVNFLKETPPKSVILSPGLSFEEMPPDIANRSRDLYEDFVKEHLPTFVDAHNAQRSDFSKIERKESYKLSDLEEYAQIKLAVPYSSILKIAQIYYLSSNFSPEEKFKKFLEFMSSDLDCLSAKEVGIAAYCFSDPDKNGFSENQTRKAIVQNFLKDKKGKTPRSLEDFFRIAFNGASDLNHINTANYLNNKGLDGVRQDVWIVSFDSKLKQFCDIFPYADGVELGKYIWIPQYFDKNKEYWNEVLHLWEAKISARERHTPFWKKRDSEILKVPKKVEAGLERILDKNA